MGQRGPIRDPNSRRGRAEIARRQKLAENPESKPQRTTGPTCLPESGSGDLPTCPAWLPRNQAELFANLVMDLLAAKVPVRRIDSHAVAMAVQCLAGVEDAAGIYNDAETAEQRIAALRIKAQFQKDLKDWLQLICATPGARARIGLKAAPEKKAGPLAALIAARQGKS